ncbi:hypothetical protein DGMP_02420 [Desulfomarina profundi]|uniref:Dinitrogenase iron-molybdenum cofactor biosynthesis domain-containing protein n=1 Tax=Desulfomarina profundi TaxID=2772557 RepID=A0A8D5FJX6_9BACT|nr:hypothetical protein DGMP_02420 [Desulfomarina profundi]
MWWWRWSLISYNGKGEVMKVAVTARGVTLDDEVDPRFGRAPYILMVDTETFEFEAVDNSENVNAFKGAGIQAATMVSEKGLKCCSPVTVVPMLSRLLMLPG